MPARSCSWRPVRKKMCMSHLPVRWTSGPSGNDRQEVPSGNHRHAVVKGCWYLVIFPSLLHSEMPPVLFGTGFMCLGAFPLVSCECRSKLGASKVIVLAYPCRSRAVPGSEPQATATKRILPSRRGRRRRRPIVVFGPYVRSHCKKCFDYGSGEVPAPRRSGRR